MNTNGEIRNGDSPTPLPTNGAIAIYGGDSRTERLVWPTGYDIRFFKSARDGGSGESLRLINSLRAGKIDTLILLTRFMGHSDFDMLKRSGRTYAKSVITWTKGAGELSRQIAELVPAPLPRALLEKKEPTVKPIKKTAPVVERAPIAARKGPKPKITEQQKQEIFALAGKMGQTEIGRKYGIAQSSVSYLLRGLKHGQKDGSRAPAIKPGRRPKQTNVLAPSVPPASILVDDRPPVIIAIDKMREEWRALSDALLEGVASCRADVEAMRGEMQELAESNESLRTMVDTLRRAISEFRLNATRSANEA